MLRDIEADIYVLVDGDSTYASSEIHTLIAPVLKRSADMAVGDRISHGGYKQQNRRWCHDLGNRLVCALVNILFKATLHDVMSGYRAFSREFAEAIHLRGNGFEVETEITIHGLTENMRILEVPISYSRRPPDSVSKLKTIRDGFRVLLTIFKLLIRKRIASKFRSFANTPRFRMPKLGQ